MDKPDIPVICGAVYQREINGTTHQVLCTSTRVGNNGKIHGTFQMYGFAAERLAEGHETTNLLELVAMPTAVEKKRKRKAS